MSHDHVRELIFDAFAQTSAPTADEIAPDKWDLDLERSDIRAALAEIAWQDVPFSFFSEHRQALFFLAPRGWAYYLPAYMLAAIDHYEEASTALTEVVSSLMPSRDAEIDASRRTCLTVLTARQCDAVVKFIEWAADAHPDALDEYDRDILIHSIKAECGVPATPSQ